MAYGYLADYGYYIDPNGQAQGQLASPYLDGLNISDCVLTDKDSKYFIPEVDDLPYPTNVQSESSDREAMRGRFCDEIHTGATPTQGISDWRYFSLLPIQPSAASINDQDIYSYAYWSMCQITLVGNYNPFTIVDQNKKGNPFRWCPKLCKAMIPQLYGKVACTFVYLKNWKKLIDQFGNLYTVGSTGTITRSGNQSFYGSISYLWIISYTSGTVIAYPRITYAYQPPNSSTTYLYSCQVSLRGGSTYKWSVFSDNDTVNSYVADFYGINTGSYDFKSEIGEDPDPYNSSSGKSDTGGGNGTGIIPAPQSTPYPGAANLIEVTSFINIYVPTAQDLLDLANEMWAPNVWELIKGMTLQPMDSIISFHIMPWGDTVSSGTEQIHLGFYTATATSKYPLNDYYLQDCGTLNISEIWGSYLDYKSRFSLYLPFIGSVPLQPEDVLEHEINVKYMMNILTGNVLAYVIQNDTGVILATFGGNCSFQIPLTGADKSALVSGIIQMAGGALTGMATGGLSAPVGAALASSALNVAASKTNYQKAGGLGANTAYMGIRVPYITAYVPNLCTPDKQNEFLGYPSYITSRLGNNHGYTEVYKSHVEAAGASGDELQEIERLLEAGVIV